MTVMVGHRWLLRLALLNTSRRCSDETLEYILVALAKTNTLTSVPSLRGQI